MRQNNYPDNRGSQQNEGAKANRCEDFEINVPELLLKQQQRTKDILTCARAIASISLIVGGIGIIEYHVCSVMERIKRDRNQNGTGSQKMDIVGSFFQRLAE